MVQERFQQVYHKEKPKVSIKQTIANKTGPKHGSPNQAQ